MEVLTGQVGEKINKVIFKLSIEEEGSAREKAESFQAGRSAYARPE